jgi:hypothetical protein
MPTRAKEGASLAALVAIAAPLCRRAEAARPPRRGPGRPPEIPDWALATMILVAVLHRKRTKSAQFAFWGARRGAFAELMPGQRMPGRSTYFERYRRAGALFREAIRLAGGMAVARGWADPACVAVDQSLVAARGKAPRQRRPQRGTDPDASWGRSAHDGWVYGYAYEVVVTAPESGVVWPLSASVDAAARHGTRTFAEKLPDLPGATRWVLADRGYDSNALAEAVEWRTPRRRTGRHFLCPEVCRPNVGRVRRSAKESAARSRRRRLREARRRLLDSPRGRRLYARRRISAEPFHARLKALFGLEDRAWHRGLENNRTQMLAAILAYQVLLIHNHRSGQPDACVQCVLDPL